LDPDEPWSNIGYWGDHQVIYLVKLLELSQKYHPEKLNELLTTALFTYANIPYRIKSFEAILAHPTETIAFDDSSAEIIDRRVDEWGSDGKLIFQGTAIYRVNMTEKLLVPLLAKLSNFVPEGGIWMNTQRPEWNDANNALVGNGLSMVTLYYLRRYVTVFHALLSGLDHHVEITRELGAHFQEMSEILGLYREHLDAGFSDQVRFNFVAAVGTSGSAYRESIYPQRFDQPQMTLQKSEILDFLTLCREYIDHSIAANQRNDHLYHAYNLVRFRDRSCTVDPLYEMLEGQVAAISSGYLDPAGVLKLLDALRKSSMYRADQRSYTLYPDKTLTPFLTKNLVNPELLEKSKFLSGEISQGNPRIIEKDHDGAIHFNGNFRNADDLKKKLDAIDGLTDEEHALICDAFIETFDHRKFTGRSGTFFKYEGLGSIYWHMVSKLLLAVQESYLSARQSGATESVLKGLREHLAQIEEGIGAGKSPGEYGAFPIDPYSHTPGFAGVQQPGMTGQVKEDILVRFGELGVDVIDGRLQFDPDLLPAGEFIQAKQEWSLPGNKITLGPGQLGFTVCGIPVIYTRGEQKELSVEFQDGKTERFPGTKLPADISNQVFKRSTAISRIEVRISSPTIA
jgi:hypothetical protein